MKILSKLDNTGMIEEVADKRYVTDAEKLTWNSKPDTDTVTTINGKTGAISKADIVALGIAPTEDLHNHDNKSIIDKFTEVDNKPYYNGKEIGGGGGGGSPNLDGGKPATEYGGLDAIVGGGVNGSQNSGKKRHSERVDEC